MAWEGSNRRSELPPDWAKIRARILKRDGGRCTWKLPSGARCPRGARDVDHVNQSRNDDHSDANLQSLCPTHHAQKTSKEGFAGRRKGRGPKRPPEKHPGIRPFGGARTVP